MQTLFSEQVMESLIYTSKGLYVLLNLLLERLVNTGNQSNGIIHKVNILRKHDWLYCYKNEYAYWLLWGGVKIKKERN